jgi:hypothetical protein
MDNGENQKSVPPGHMVIFGHGKRTRTGIEFTPKTKDYERGGL